MLDTLDSFTVTVEMRDGWKGGNECVSADAPVGWVLAQLAHMTPDISDDDMVEIAIARSVDCAVDEYELLLAEGRVLLDDQVAPGVTAP